MGFMPAAIDDDAHIVLRSNVSNATPDTYNVLIDDGYFREETDASTITITAVRIDLTQDLLPADRNLIVMADTVSIAGPLRIPGRTVTMYARQVIATSANASIDVSGAPHVAGSPGNYLPGARAQDGGPGPGRGDAGGRGSDGAAGATGTHGGDVVIYAGAVFNTLKAVTSGGDGGRGQDAGRGGAGQQGKQGADAVISGPIYDEHISRGPMAGERGGAGGDGGNGGNGGNGGDAGSVQLGLIEKIGTVTTVMAGGVGGQGGAGATGGTGGAGGPGGRNADCRSIGRGMDTMRQCSLNQSRAGDGPPGNAGRWGNSAHNGNNGRMSALLMFDANTARRAISQAATPAFRSMLLRQAELNYLNGDYRIAATLLGWLRGLGGLEASRAETLLTQMHQGLNYYGRAANHVPLVTLDYYLAQVTDLLVLGQAIENARTTYRANAASRQEKLAALDSAIKESQSLLANMKDAIVQLASQSAAVQEEILGLVTARGRQRDVMLAAAEEFRKAVEQKALGCSFADLIKFATTIVSVGKAAYGDLTAISGAIGGLKAVTATLDGLQNVVKQIEIAAKGVQDLAKQWAALSKTLSPEAPDVSKIVADKEDFDALIKPYLDMPEAVRYKKHVNDFLGLAQACNKRLLDYNGLVVSQINLATQIALKEKERNSIVEKRAQTTDPTAARFRSFIETAYEDICKQIMGHLYEEHAAYRYWLLRELPFVVQQRTLAGLTAVHTQLKSDILNVLNQRTTPMQTFDKRSVVLSESTRPLQFERFRAGYRNERNEAVHDLTFSIPIDAAEFQNSWAQVLAVNFSVEIPGIITSNGGVSVRLLHSGRAILRDQKGATMEFSHVYRLGEYSFETATGRRIGGGNLGGDSDNKQYIGLSPFTAWTLRLKADHNPGLNLRQVKEITINFGGKYYPVLNMAQAGEPAA